MSPGPVVVGVDAQQRSHRALATAERVAALLNRQLVVACVYELDRWFAFVDASAWVERARDRADAVLAAATRDIARPADVDTRAVGAPSAAHGLHQLANELDASVVVVGTSHRSGVARRVAPGGTAEHLLHGAPCPILVTPRAVLGVGPVVVAYDATTEADAALDWGCVLARALGRPLLLMNVTVPTTPRHNPEIYAELIEYVHGIADKTLAGGLERVPGDLSAAAVVAEGIPGEQIASRADTEAAAVVVCGSRGYGPVRAVMMGSTARSLISHASCPVMVVPRPD